MGTVRVCGLDIHGHSSVTYLNSCVLLKFNPLLFVGLQLWEHAQSRILVLLGMFVSTPAQTRKQNKKQKRPLEATAEKEGGLASIGPLL